MFRSKFFAELPQGGNHQKTKKTDLTKSEARSLEASEILSLFANAGVKSADGSSAVIMVGKPTGHSYPLVVTVPTDTKRDENRLREMCCIEDGHPVPTNKEHLLLQKGLYQEKTI